MLEGEYDLDYRSVPQPRGNSEIRQARARILGGCSSHNTMIALRPPDADFDDWAARGADGWDAAVHAAVVRAAGHTDRAGRSRASQPLSRRRHHLRFAGARDPGARGLERAPYADGTGWLPIGYTPETGVRSSSSVAYLHPVIDARPNLEVITGARVLRVSVVDGAATGRHRAARGRDHSRSSRPGRRS